MSIFRSWPRANYSNYRYVFCNDLYPTIYSILRYSGRALARWSNHATEKCRMTHRGPNLEAAKADRAWGDEFMSQSVGGLQLTLCKLVGIHD